MTYENNTQNVHLFEYFDNGEGMKNTEIHNSSFVSFRAWFFLKSSFLGL